MPKLTLRERVAAAARSKGRPTVWIPQGIIRACFDEASSKFPFETGGTFMGWWADSHTVVITGVIGAGPKAHHGRYAFQPDEMWQLDQIARHYEDSGRRETYLGDWHSHPNASSGSLSWTDRHVLRRVITTPSARCPSPLMTVVWAQPDDWQFTAWCARLQPRLVLWSHLMVTQAAVKVSASI